MSEDDRRSELREFLKDRRARINPADAGIAATGRRRVPGLRREEVAGLAGIGVSWYTALESGEATGVSAETVSSVADALRLSESERNYLFTLTGVAPVDELQEPGILVREATMAIAFPAYVITATWDVLCWNAAFRCVWGIAADEPPFNAVERLFLDPRARPMHGAAFSSNIAPVVAMLRSAVGRRPHLATLRRIREALMADPQTRTLWDAYEISDPLISNTCAITSPIGPFTYEALTLANPGAVGIVVHIPDQPSRARLAAAMSIDCAPRHH